jgi:hypothetical protein
MSLTLEQAALWSIAQDTQALFGSELGKRVLAQLKKDFMDRTSFHTDPIQMAFMEGERHVLLTIQRRLEMRMQDFVHTLNQEDQNAAS